VGLIVEFFVSKATDDALDGGTTSEEIGNSVKPGEVEKEIQEELIEDTDPQVRTGQVTSDTYPQVRSGQVTSDTDSQVSQVRHRPSGQVTSDTDPQVSKGQVMSGQVTDPQLRKTWDAGRECLSKNEKNQFQFQIKFQFFEMELTAF
jgi:hypothetical protein